MNLENKTSPIQTIMGKVVSKIPFNHEEIVKEIGEDKKEIVETILLNLSLGGYIQFDLRTNSYSSCGKEIKYFE